MIVCVGDVEHIFFFAETRTAWFVEPLGLAVETAAGVARGVDHFHLVVISVTDIDSSRMPRHVQWVLQLGVLRTSVDVTVTEQILPIENLNENTLVIFFLSS